MSDETIEAIVRDDLVLAFALVTAAEMDGDDLGMMLSGIPQSESALFASANGL